MNKSSKILELKANILKTNLITVFIFITMKYPKKIFF